MIGTSIKTFRMRLGMTQWDLAERLGVDQGRVSRWERGVEKPRPATAAKLRDMILREDEAQARRRNDHLIKHSLRPALLMDRESRLLLANRRGVAEYRRRFNIDLDEQRGTEFDRFAALVGFPKGWDVVRDSGLFEGKTLLVRMYVNSYGAGHVTQYEPVFEDGRMVRVRAEVVASLQFPPNPDYTVERVEAVYLDQPDRLVVVYRGSMAELAQLV